MAEFSTSKEIMNSPSPVDRQILNPWFIASRQNPRAKLLLFCFPYAGGGDLIFRDWHKGLPSGIEVRRVLLPGRGSRLREPLYNHLIPLVKAIAEALIGHVDRPFALFGHSLGAMISFELARYLRDKYAIQPAQLFVSGRRAPQIPQIEPLTYNLPDDEFLCELRRLNGTPEEVLTQPELMELMLPILRSDFSLCQTYAYSAGAPLNCPIAAFGGIDDIETNDGQLEAWREQTTGFFSTQVFPGGHFFIHQMRPQLLQSLSDRLSQLINEID